MNTKDVKIDLDAMERAALAAYVDWLAGREDSEAMRVAWGGLYFEGEK